MKNRMKRYIMPILISLFMLLNAVPIFASDYFGELQTEKLQSVVELHSREDMLVNVEAEKLNSGEGCIYGCVPYNLYSELSETEYYLLQPGHSIEQHLGIYVYAECVHGVNAIAVKDNMCSYYQSDWVNKILSITVTYMGLQTRLPVVFQFPLYDYDDMSTTDWFYSDAEFAYKQLIMLGMDPTHWGPYVPLSRAQFATILYRLMNEPEYAVANQFPDVLSGSWYDDAVSWAAEEGIVTGYQNGLFGPSDMITREQMAVMMYRFADSYGFDVYNKADLTHFIDESHIPAYAKDAMAWAVGQGIITGKDSGTRLAPLENTVRAECAAILYRFIYGEPSTPQPTPDPIPEPTPDTNPTPNPDPGNGLIPPQDFSGSPYVLNTNTYKFHYPGCSSANNISPGNRADYVGYRDILISHGYEACKRCNP